MNDSNDQNNEDLETLFEEDQTGIFGELLYFLKTSKKWWLTPILLAILLLGALVALGSSGAAPFIYTLF